MALPRLMHSVLCLTAQWLWFPLRLALQVLLLIQKELAQRFCVILIMLFVVEQIQLSDLLMVVA
ncbi:hypothetical protein ATY27_03225 [Rheinheimera sp. F8]|nr:hypothetical protein ATY27_03225 [Rheinheimera sp. F8]